jgi:hypothetical protein
MLVVPIVGSCVILPLIDHVEFGHPGTFIGIVTVPETGYVPRAGGFGLEDTVQELP